MTFFPVDTNFFLVKIAEIMEFDIFFSIFVCNYGIRLYINKVKL